jgi:hypothetical protein
MKTKLFHKGRLCGLIGNESKFYGKKKKKGCIFREMGIKRV